MKKFTHWLIWPTVEGNEMVATRMKLSLLLLKALGSNL